MKSGELWHGTSRYQRDTARLERLLTAALDIYGTHGFRTASVQQLCQQAEVSTRSFYELFSTQDDVLEQLYELLVQQILDDLQQVVIPTEATLIAAAQHCVATGLKSILDDERKLRVLEIEAVGANQALEKRRRLAMKSLGTAVDDVVAQLCAIYEHRPVTANQGDQSNELTGLLVVGGITEILIQRAYTPAHQRNDDTSFVMELTSVILAAYGLNSPL